ncbi:MAG: 23S rRNA (guanosine(2251)-2'-O)-methyltransferase RlmB [Holosporaceae bacterium]|jgi:23S rRNA (guanosine2251-2'-O)-methyltransferase|nr:23S rRNA (guanosine(2251)-2'-O)-methyltransferase RlmB [Holosporaceae bacterium]
MSRAGKKHGRNEEWIYGRHAVRAALQNPNREILRFVVLESCRDFPNGCGASAQKSEIVDRNFFNALFGKEAIHQGCAVLTEKLREYSVEELAEDEADLRPFVFLDQVSDPQNVGSILRAAAVLGARAVVVPENNSPTLTPAIIKAASGAVERVPFIRAVNLVQTINNLKKHGFWCVGLDERSDRKISETPLKGKFIIVIGSEGEGMRRLTREACDFLVKLHSFGDFSTLNAAQAAVISLYEVLRQNEA